MLRFLKTKHVGVFLAVLAALLLLTLCTARSGSAVLSNLFGLTTPLQKAAARSLEKNTRPYDDLAAENQELRQQVAELTNRLSGYYAYQAENTQLRRFLGLKNNNPDFSVVYGDVIGRDSADLFYSFRVDKGTRDNVKAGDPVVTEAGLVGRVSAVSGMHCTVTTLLAPGGIAAVDQVSRDAGVVTGDVTLAGQGLVRLSYLERENTVQPGDMIVTSAIGGNYPKGLLIGEAVEVKTGETDVSLYATVKPYVDVKTVTSVLIITDFDPRGTSDS